MTNNIGYIDRTWNPISGCTPISEGCKNCWAKRFSKRLAGRYGYPKDEPFEVTIHPDKLDEPYRWKEAQKVAVCYMGDLFHEGVPIKFFADIMDVVLNNPRHTFIFCTKRPGNMFLRLGQKALSHQVAINYEYHIPLKNLWLGTSVENQRTADERIPILLETPAAKHFVSVEPMLGPVSLRWLAAWNGQAQQPRPATTNELDGLRRLDWVIAGPETGPGARPCNKEWVENLYDQCRAGGVPFWDKTNMLGKNIKERP